MTDLGNLLARGLGATGDRIEIHLAKCLTIDWAAQIATVQIAGQLSTIPVRMSGQVARVGDMVWILLVDSEAFTIGRPSRPATGTVAASPVGSTVSVVGDDGVTYTVGFSPSYTPASGHRVLLNWDAGGHILIRTDAADIPTNPVEPPPPGEVARSRTFNPIDSGSYRAGGWQSGSVYYGSSFPSAGYFFGTQIADSIPDGAPASRIRTYLEVTSASGAGSMTLSLHTSPTRPGGGLSLDQTINIGAMPNGFRGDVELPLAWADLLKTGARFGIGTSGPGLRVLRGAPVGGAITIDWKE